MYFSYDQRTFDRIKDKANLSTTLEIGRRDFTYSSVSDDEGLLEVAHRHLELIFHERLTTLRLNAAKFESRVVEEAFWKLTLTSNSLEEIEMN